MCQKIDFTNNILIVQDAAFIATMEDALETDHVPTGVKVDTGDVVANHLVVLVARTESVIVQMDAVHKAVFQDSGETSVQNAAQRIVLERFVTEITVVVHRTALRDFMMTNVIKIAVITVLQRNVIDKVEPALVAVQETGKGISVRVCNISTLEYDF